MSIAGSFLKHLRSSCRGQFTNRNKATVEPIVFGCNYIDSCMLQEYTHEGYQFKTLGI